MTRTYDGTQAAAPTRTLAVDLPDNVGRRVCLEGWIHNLRSFPDFSFLILRDRSGLAQVIVQPGPELEKLHGLQNETVVRVEGTVVEEPRAPRGVDVKETTLDVLAPVTEPGPFELNKRVLKPSLDVFLNHAPYGLRYPKKIATFRILATMVAGFREYLSEQGFVEIHTPKLVGSATEGGANVFRVDYFGRPAFLAQSPQLYKQIMVGVFERVFEVGPVFRAEEHYTSRHLNEYTSLDLEMGFIESQRDVMDMLQNVLAAMLTAIHARNSQDVELLGIELPEVGVIPSITFREGQELILRRHGEDRSHEPDLSPQDERWLSDWAREEHGSEFLFVTHFPTAKRAFYTYPDPTDPTYSESFDLLFRGVEMVSGSRRINEYDQLLRTIEDRGLNPDAFAGYLEAFKYGMPPEGGFAIGAERLAQMLIGADNLRETTLFPRDVNRLAP